MLTDVWTVAYKVKFMNFLALNSTLTAPYSAAPSSSAEPFSREKLMDAMPGRRIKWPFSVAVSSVAKASAKPDAGVVYSDDSGAGRFIT